MRFEVYEEGSKVWIETRDVGLELTIQQIERIYNTMQKEHIHAYYEHLRKNYPISKEITKEQKKCVHEWLKIEGDLFVCTLCKLRWKGNEPCVTEIEFKKSPMVKK